MKYVSFFTGLGLFFFSCTSEPNTSKPTSDSNMKDEVAIQTRDSIVQVLLQDDVDSTHPEYATRQKTKSELIDSLFHVAFKGPFVIAEDLDSSTIDIYTRLAKETKGKAIFTVTKETLDKTITSIIQEDVVAETDLVLLIDKTASMTDDIEKVKEGLGQIIQSLAKKSHVRLAIGLYGDVNYMGDEWFDFEVFGYDYKKANAFLNNIELIGNYDDPESVYDAFFEVANSNFWRSNSKRMVILIGDAAPQEKPLSKYSIHDVINKSKEGKVFMNFYPVLVNPEIVLEKLSDDLQAKPIITKVYPNPSSGEINFEFLDKNEYAIEVFSTTGMNVFRDKRNTWFFTHNFSNLANGAYILRVYDKEGHFDTQRFVIYK